MSERPKIPSAATPHPAGSAVEGAQQHQPTGRDSTPRARLHTRAALEPSSIDTDSREVEAVVSTGAERQLGPDTERLDVSGADLSRLNAGASVIRDHRRSTESVVGSVVPGSARVDGDKITARLRFASGSAWELVREGHLRSVSIGYTVEAVREDDGNRGKIITVTQFTPREVSLVVIPADDGARIRSGDGDGGTADDRTGDALDTAALALRHGHGEIADRVLSGQATEEQARDQIIKRMEQADMANPIQPHTMAPVTGTEQIDKMRSAAADAISSRLLNTEPETAEGREMRGHSLLDMAALFVRESGDREAAMLPRHRLAERAFNSTSDFPAVLSDAANKTVGQQYRARQTPLRRLAQEIDADDFKPVHSVSIGQPPALKPVNEGGEVERGTTDDRGESIQLQTFARVFAVTRQALVNDDLNLFSDFTRRMADSAVKLEADMLASVLTDNPSMSDGNALFSGAHSNVASAGSVDVATLSEARKLLRAQTDLAGGPLNLSTSYLVTGSTDETDAEKLVADINPTQVDQANPFANRLEVLTESRLDGSNAFWVFTEPSQAPVLAVAFLAGNRQPVIETRQGFDIDGMEIKVRHDFQAAAIDWRGGVQVPKA